MSVFGNLFKEGAFRYLLGLEVDFHKIEGKGSKLAPRWSRISFWRIDFFGFSRFLSSFETGEFFW